jgi:hypothetical protein
MGHHGHEKKAPREYGLDRGAGYAFGLSELSALRQYGISGARSGAPRDLPMRWLRHKKPARVRLELGSALGLGRRLSALQLRTRHTLGCSANYWTTRIMRFEFGLTITRCPATKGRAAPVWIYKDRHFLGNNGQA